MQLKLERSWPHLWRRGRQAACSRMPRRRSRRAT